MAPRNEPPPICFRGPRALRDAIDEAASMRHWTRTTWILYWIGKGLDHDRELFGMTPDEIAHDAEKAASDKARWAAARDAARSTS